MFEGRIKLKKRSGAASFVVTAVLTIIVVGVITSLSIITSRQVRQATDSDQSSRAINAAQSGVEAYAALVGNDPTFERESCIPPDDDDDELTPEPQINDVRSSGKQDIDIVCGRVKRSGDLFRGFLERDQAITFSLGNARKPDGSNGGISQMSFYWNLYNSDSLNFEQPDIAANPINYPTLIDPQGSRDEPATLEFSFTWCPKNAPANPSECDYNRGDFLNSTTNKNKGIPTKTVVIRPWSSSEGMNSGCDELSNQIGDYTCHIPATITADPSSHPGICSPGPGCLLPQDLTDTLNDLPLMTGGASKIWDAAILENYNLTVTVRARYASTHFAVKFGGIGSGSGEARIWDFPQTMIEVIARSGDVYRSVSGNKTTQYGINDILAYAVFSGKNICKNMIAYDDPAIKPQNTCAEP